MITEPWPWYISGPLIGLTIPLLLILKNKTFGVSSSFTHVCNVIILKQSKDFKAYYNENSWNLFFILGMIISSVFYFLVIGNPGPGNIESLKMLELINTTNSNTPLPIFFGDTSYILSSQGLLTIGIGGICIGFGTRYGNGCTSGHAIMGLSNLQLTSLIAVIGFFIGGLLITYFPVLKDLF